MRCRKLRVFTVVCGCPVALNVCNGGTHPSFILRVSAVAAFRSNVQGLKLGPTSDSTYMFKVSK